MMYSNRNLTFLSLVLSCTAACSSGTNDPERIADTEVSSHELSDADVVSGFESLFAWSATPSSVTRALTTDHVEGTNALSVSNLSGYTALVSDVTRAPASLDSIVTLRIKPPAGHTQAAWKGHVQLSVDSPSRGLHSAYIGQADLNALSAGSFGTLSFDLPSNIRTALSTGSVSDVRYTLALNVPLSGPYLLDALHLGTRAVDTTPTPTPVAYTGGGDVALLWEPITWSRETARYDVYRNGQLIGTAIPSLYRDLQRASSATYIDTSVVASQAYSYEVQAVADDGVRAARSAPVSITHSTLGTPVPTILIDDGGYPHTRPFLELGKSFLTTWYPKIANILTYPEYLPPGTITLRAVRDLTETEENECAGAGWVDTYSHPGVVHICAYDNLGSSDDVGLFVHEATHLMQEYVGPELAAAGEGIASWAGNLATGLDHKKASAPLGSFYDDYEYGAYFFDWIARTYAKPNFVRDLNLVCHGGTYTDAWLTQYTGHTLGQMFGAMTGTTYTSPGPLKNAAGRYAFPSDSDLNAGSRIELVTTPPSNPARFFQGPISGAVGPLRWEKDVCLAEDGQGFVVVQHCSAGNRTPWRYMSATGAFLNETSYRCLQPEGGALTDGTPLVTAPCTGSAIQRWQPLPP
jgi:hypothetical protein